MVGSIDNPQVLLKQGVAWLKTRQNKLVDQLVDRMAEEPELSYQRLPGFLRKLVAKDMYQDLIKRLENNALDADAVRQKMLDGLKKGADLKSLTVSVDLMTAIAVSEARQGLIGQPAMQNILINRIEYFSTLIKSICATAAIEYEKQKMDKHKHR